MGSRGLVPWLAMATVMALAGSSMGDLEKDKKECAEQLVGLATCLPYVSGQAKAPTTDCCSGLKLVLQKTKVCLCILIKDRDDPDLGLKINATLALGLPDSCHTPSNITECPKLMNLAPKSPEAKIFEDYGKNANKSSNATSAAPGNGKTASSSSGDIKNGVGKLRVDKIWGFSCTMIISMFLFIFHVA